MDIICDKNYIKEKRIKQIIELFASNYGKYHYEQFQSYEGIINLLLDKQFECIIIEDDNRILGFGGYYIKFEQKDIVKEISLAHLLVDYNFRGNGYGTLIEEVRQKMIQKIEGDKVIYASCVENPRNSIQMKLDRNYYVGGFRYCYRPGKNMRNNAVVLIYSKCIRHEIYIEKPNNITQRIIRNGNPDIKFKDSKFYNYYKIKIKNDKMLGRCICNVLNICDKGIRINSHFLNQLKFNSEYVVIYIKPDIDGFSNIDKTLLENSFFPLCYIPYINEGVGILEYQYIKSGIKGLYKDNTISFEAKKFLENLL